LLFTAQKVILTLGFGALIDWTFMKRGSVFAFRTFMTLLRARAKKCLTSMHAWRFINPVGWKAKGIIG